MSNHSPAELLRRCLDDGSLRPALKDNALVATGDWEGKSEGAVRKELNKLIKRCSGLQSIKVMKPSGHNFEGTGTVYNRAYLNFYSTAEAKVALAALRADPYMFGKDLKCMYSALDHTVKDHDDIKAMLSCVIRVRPRA